MRDIPEDVFLCIQEQTIWSYCVHLAYLTDMHMAR